MIKYKIKTQCGLILEKMILEKDRWFLASEFCGGSDDCPFIGYKAPTRIAEMQKDGLIISMWSSRTTALGDRLKEYKINIEYFNFRINDNKIEIDKKFIGQAKLI